ncbi:hypothetical protein DFH07DRAFT_1023208 [Mycena maculata]|uniref:Uncharacterized protein n=1 Tax=Mycena maculata TaxID=230809 RepID=A0AAD7J9U1_9AGAR|nr:hypothetical protein DFH07DRAFT_1023208 [Mycena maculata]
MAPSHSESQPAASTSASNAVHNPSNTNALTSSLVWRRAGRFEGVPGDEMTGKKADVANATSSARSRPRSPASPAGGPSICCRYKNHHQLPHPDGLAERLDGPLRPLPLPIRTIRLSSFNHSLAALLNGYESENEGEKADDLVVPATKEQPAPTAPAPALELRARPAGTELVYVAEIKLWTGELKASEVPGRYVSYWHLCDGQGPLFGDSLWIEYVFPSL